MQIIITGVAIEIKTRNRVIFHFNTVGQAVLIVDVPEETVIDVTSFYDNYIVLDSTLEMRFTK